MALQEKIDLVLVSPRDGFTIYQKLGTSLTALEPPVWAGLLATFVRQQGFSVRIIDANAEGLTAEEVTKQIDAIAPLLTAIVVYGHQPSASTQNMASASQLGRMLRESAPHLRTLLVGGHVAALPERTIREEKVDFVCSGEGPYTVLELLQALKANSDDYSKVSGLGYREGKGVRFTPPAPLVKNLDGEMPGIAWDLLPMEKYRAHNWHCFGELKRQPYATLYTTLGCPYHCTFCCIQSPFKAGEKKMGLGESVNSYRSWSPQSVMLQIDQLVREHGVRNIKIADEMFVLNRRHVMGICDLIIERGYDLNIWAYARIDTVKEDMLPKLKQAGFNWLAFGVEAASERVRDDVQKSFNEDDILTTLKKVRESGIHVIGNYIFGLPEDDHETMQKTLDLALDINCEFANFYCAMAYPGSPLYEMALKSGWSLPSAWSGYSQHSVDMLPLPTKYMPVGDVIRFRDRAFQSYFNSPRYLDMIQEKFGAKTVQHIREMTSVSLSRTHAA